MRTEHWASVTEIATCQHGLVTRAQVLAAGASPRTLHRAVDRGLLTPVRRQVYGVVGVPHDIWQALMAACLAGRPSTLASHRAAAGLHGFPGILPGAVEVTSGRASKRALAGVRCHTSLALAGEDATVVGGIPTTSPARTIVDLAGVLEARPLGLIVDHARRRGLCTPSEIGTVLDRVRGTGRAGAGTLAALIADRERTDSELELKWLRRLRRAGLGPPALQHHVAAPSRLMVVDFAWPDRRVGVEVDGWEPHRARSAWDRDHDKINAYAEVGWKVLFVTSRTPVHDAVRQLRLLLCE